MHPQSTQGATAPAVPAARRASSRPGTARCACDHAHRSWPGRSACLYTGDPLRRTPGSR